MRRVFTLALAMALFTALAAPAASARPAWSEKSSSTIVETAVALSGTPFEFDDNDADFDILVALLVDSGAVGLLDGSTDWTVFAPTDAAFLALAGTDSEAAAFEGLRGLDILGDVLAYHLTDGVRNSVSVTRAAKITMANGDTITARGGFVDAANSDANFVATDIRVADGIIHVIDGVLLP